MEEREEQQHVFTLACLAQKSTKYEMAISAWEKYLAVRSFDPKAHFNLGVCANAVGKGAAALASFEKAFELQPSMADAGANAAGLLIQAGEAERACALCYLALKGDPDSSAALYNLNTALRMAGRPNEAIAFSWRWIRERLPPGTPSYAIATSLETLSTAPGNNSRESWNDDGPLPFSLSVAKQAELPIFRGSTGAFGSDAAKSTGCVGDCSACDATVCEDGSGGEGFVTVVCVRWGSKYGPEYVERLAAGVRRNLRRSHRFICYTDDVQALGGMAGVVGRPLGTRGCGEWKGWWHKAFLFSREAELAGRILYIDLDTVIAGSLDDVAGYSGPFAVLSAEGMANERRPAGLNSSVMSWDAGEEAATVQPVYGLLQEAYSVVTACVHKLDHWLEMTVPGAESLHSVVSDQIVEYASLRLASAEAAGKDAVERDSLLVELPRNARIVCFPLEPKPHQVTEYWVSRMWRGGGGNGAEM